MTAIILIPNSGLFDGSDPDDSNSDTCGAGVREEEAEADEFRPEPEPEEVEDARLRGAVGLKTIRYGGVIPEGY